MQCLFKTCLFRNGPTALPLISLLAAFSRTAQPNNFTLDSGLVWVLSNTPAKCEANWMNGCRDNWRTDRHTDRQRILTFIVRHIHDMSADEDHVVTSKASEQLPNVPCGDDLSIAWICMHLSTNMAHTGFMTCFNLKQCKSFLIPFFEESELKKKSWVDLR